MNRRHLALALALFVLAALAAAGLYAGNPQADRSAGSSKSSGSQAIEQQVRELQNRVTSLEQRIKKLEKRPVWTEQIVSPPLVFPNPNPGQPGTENDGFPPARFLLIDGKSAVVIDPTAPLPAPHR